MKKSRKKEYKQNELLCLVIESDELYYSLIKLNLIPSDNVRICFIRTIRIPTSTLFMIDRNWDNENV